MTDVTDILTIFAVVGVLLLIAFGGTALLLGLFLNSGESIDTAYGLEQNNYWYKLYLKDDHKTVYCIDKDDTNLISIAKQSSLNKEKVKVTYQEYIFRGSLCNINDDYSTVVVTNLEVLE